MNRRRINYIVSYLLVLFSYSAMAQQSPDRIICTCFTDGVSSNFMLATKAIYGRIGITLTPGLELPPTAGQPVRFVIPVLPIKAGCDAQYAIEITNRKNEVIHTATSATNELVYSFSQPKEIYSVYLSAKGKPASGGGGNCIRSIRFIVKPVAPRF